jgi:hypothetical protein
VLHSLHSLVQAESHWLVQQYESIAQTHDSHEQPPHPFDVEVGHPVDESVQTPL